MRIKVDITEREGKTVAGVWDETEDCSQEDVKDAIRTHLNIWGYKVRPNSIFTFSHKFAGMSVGPHDGAWVFANWSA